MNQNYQIILIILIAGTMVPDPIRSIRIPDRVSETTTPPNEQLKNAVFALGSFWRSEAVFGCLNGVVRTTAGYSGGSKPNPEYRSLADHAESVQVEYDPRVISFRQLLEVFWSSHDSRQVFSQGPDVGSQYRSIIFTNSTSEARLAAATKEKEQSKSTSSIVTTQILPLGVEAWNKETLVKQETAKLQVLHEFDGRQNGKHPVQMYVELPAENLPEQVTGVTEKAEYSVETEKETAYLIDNGHSVDGKTVPRIPESLLLENIKWKHLALLVFVWVSFFAVQIVKTHLVACSLDYWILNLVQVVIGSSVAIYQAVNLYRGTTVITSSGKNIPEWTIYKFLLYFCSGILAGTVGGLLGIGGGTILTPLFLELGVPPQVASATSAFSMLFSSSLSVVEYYILKRFPIPYSSYLFSVAVIAAFTGQHIVRKIIAVIGRTSIIIFILAFSISVSALCLGAVGIYHMIYKLQHHEYMGFERMCH